MDDDKWTIGWIDEQMDKWADGWIDRLIDTDRQTDI